MFIMAPPEVYRREFSRTDANDSDHLVTEDFVQENFVDIFGKLLANGTDVVSRTHYKDLALWFWGAYRVQN